MKPTDSKQFRWQTSLLLCVTFDQVEQAAKPYNLPVINNNNNNKKCMFGWQTVDDLYQQELERVSQNLTRMVPRLKEAHCLRDAWTNLNVHPAKIMQVSGVC